MTYEAGSVNETSSARQHNHRNRRDLKAAWSEFVGRIAWGAFVSLTFDPKKGRPDRPRTVREVTDWCNRLSHGLRRSVGWIFVAEKRSDGSWHAHALIAGATVEEVESLATAWTTRNGRIDVRQVNDSAVAVYVTKNAYATNDVELSDNLADFVPEEGISAAATSDEKQHTAPGLPISAGMVSTGAAVTAYTRCQDLPEYLTPDEAMSFMRMSRSKVYEMLRRKKIPSIRLGNCYRIPKSFFTSGDFAG